ncbi:MAG TPA: hypothetical protein DDX39_04520 [Bacteroidales bacterium]|nr:MAG: hypothetical protein A2W98_10480 [Bacteroidetes bacterium GWF2_33_38]HBF87888.1 hypothetical protein [Bacteroidales bacterium]
MIRVVVFSILLLVGLASSAQTVAVSDSTKKEDYFSYLSNPFLYPGKILIKQDADIEKLVNIHIEYGEKREGFPGYRIRIFSDLGYEARKNAENTRSFFMKQHPDIPNYLLYDDPNFKVVVGDFRTKSEALKFLKLIEIEYPNAFIIKDLIKCPR